jgi:hypothetical protein
MVRLSEQCAQIEQILAVEPDPCEAALHTRGRAVRLIVRTAALASASARRVLTMAMVARLVFVQTACRPANFT